MLSHGTEIFAFQDGAYRLISSEASVTVPRSFDVLVEFAKEGRVAGMPALDPYEHRRTSLIPRRPTRSITRWPAR